MSIATIDDGHIRYDLRGHGPPIMLLLPMSVGPTGRGVLLEALAQHYTVITLDPRGTGGSSPAPDKMTITTQAEDVKGLMEFLDIKPASFICHSTGCGVGLSLAAIYPEITELLVLTSPWIHGDPHLTTIQNLRIAAAKTLDPKQYAHFNSMLLFPPDFRRIHLAGFNDLAEKSINNPQDPGLIAQRLNAILEFDARPLLPSIQCKTLVITGQDDQLMPPWYGAEIAEGIAHADLTELDGGGHMLPETRATEFISLVLSFL